MAQMGKPLLDWKDKEWVYEQWCNGYTQAEIADAIGCNTKTIQRFLCKKQKIKKPLVKGGKAMSEESDKAYRRKWYMEHREEQIARTKQYREEHKEELKAKRKAAARERMRRYREEHPDKVKEIRQRHNEKVKQELKENQYTVTKEEWFKRYGYEMGSTEGWENWLGWDNRIRRSEE